MKIQRSDITDEELERIARRRESEQKNQKKKMQKKQRRALEFSKFIMLCMLFSAFYVIFFASYIIRRTGNTTYLDTLIVEVFKFSKVAVGFYAAKAGAENVFKIRKNAVLMPHEETENEEEIV